MTVNYIQLFRQSAASKTYFKFRNLPEEVEVMVHVAGLGLEAKIGSTVYLLSKISGAGDHWQLHDKADMGNPLTHGSLSAMMSILNSHIGTALGITRDLEPTAPPKRRIRVKGQLNEVSKIKKTKNAKRRTRRDHGTRESLLRRGALKRE